jgi:excisionase family DNA binding protein
MKSRKAKHPGSRNVPGGSPPLPIDEFRRVVDADPELRTVTLDDVVKTYDVSKRSLLRYVAGGELKATRFGRKYVITLAALRAFLASNRMNEKPSGTIQRARSGKR